MLATRVEQWYQQALKKSMQQGLEQGLLRGEARLLERQLIRRFGPLPEWVREKLESATEAELQTWADAVLEVPSLEAVFGSERKDSSFGGYDHTGPNK